MMRLRRALGALAVTLASAPLHAEVCANETHSGQAVTVCKVMAGADLRLFLNDEDGRALGTFGRVDAKLADEGKRLVFAMNAGMYHRDRRPVGLYIENARTQAPLITAGSAGNFGMRPNGVFCITPVGSFAIIESRAFGKLEPDCAHATQSGPMLVIDGAFHPRFLPDSASRLIRNGVGVSADGRTAYFVISGSRVNFLEFARVFREGLGVKQALFLDGNISRLHAPDLGRSDFGFPMGPIIGLVAQAR
jgi:uncharacterized protein YigE (DUF2233 family)